MRLRMAFPIFKVFAVVLTTILLVCGSNSQALISHSLLLPDQGCSIMYATNGDVMLGGNNEDFLNPQAKVWFIPSEEGSYGRVYFGFEGSRAQGGMNDQGLFFDAAALDETYPVSITGKQEYLGNLAHKIMSECATVECAIRNFEQYYDREIWSWQFLFGDATGESAIIEPKAITRQQGGYHVVTNFLQSITPPEETTDRRYLTALEQLENMSDPSINSMRDILDAVHVENEVQTIYSNVYDLNNKVVYLYYFHNYEDVVVLNLNEELMQGYHAYDLPSLFPPNSQAETWAQPGLQKYERLVESRVDTGITPNILQAYAGQYEMLEGWGDPDQALTVIAQDNSLQLRFPDYRQYELFPASPTDFFCVVFQGTTFVNAFDVHFGVNNDGQILYLELRMGDEPFRADRIGPKAFAPLTPSPESYVTTTPTAPPDSSSTVTIEKENSALTSTELGLIVSLTTIAGIVCGWMIIRRAKKRHTGD